MWLEIKHSFHKNANQKGNTQKRVMNRVMKGIPWLRDEEKEYLTSTCWVGQCYEGKYFVIFCDVFAHATTSSLSPSFHPLILCISGRLICFSLVESRLLCCFIERDSPEVREFLLTGEPLSENYCDSTSHSLLSTEVGWVCVWSEDAKPCILDFYTTGERDFWLVVQDSKREGE